MQRPAFLNTFYKFRRIISTFVLLAVFFLFYNTFLIDRTLDGLKFSLQQTALAYDVSDLNGVDMIINDVLTKELMPLEVNSMNVVNLEYAKRVLNTTKSFRRLDEIKVSLGSIIEEKNNSRNIILRILDQINRILKELFGALYNKLQSFLIVQKLQGYPKAAEELFGKALSLERGGSLREAIDAYSEFIAKYPNCSKIALAKLRLAYTYHRLQEYDKARSLYTEIAKVYFTAKEADIAKILLFKLQEKDRMLKEINKLVIKLEETPEANKKGKQELCYNLGMLNAQILNLEESNKFFKRAASIDFKNDLGMKSRFNSAWLSKQENKLEASLSELAKIVEENPKGSLAHYATFQMASVMHEQGKYQEAVNLYLKLAQDHKGEAIAALYLFQAGASCRYDLNDDDQAKKLFAQLVKQYSNSTYAKYLAPSNPTALFITYLVPRSMRIVAWRAMALLCLSGYEGEIVNFKALGQERGVNSGFSDWCRDEFPGTLGDIWVNVEGVNINLKKERIVTEGRIVVNKFSIWAKGEGRLVVNRYNSLGIRITRAFIDKVPILPWLINNSLTGIEMIVGKHFPVSLTKVSMEDGKMSFEGFGSKRALEHLGPTVRGVFGTKVTMESIKDPARLKEITDLYKKKFPESHFSSSPNYNTTSLFYDFFTRMYLYMSVKLLETVKDSKADYQRTIRTLGMLETKMERFRVRYTDGDVNVPLNRYLYYEFPWSINDEYLFDVKGVKLEFRDSGTIHFSAFLTLGHGKGVALMNAHGIEIDGTFVFDIDKESKLPYLVFKTVKLNGVSYPVFKLNLASRHCLDIMRDGHVPIKLDRISVQKGEIIWEGEGAQDFIGRVFNKDQNMLFQIFEIRKWDLFMAGVKRLHPQIVGDMWQGRTRHEMLTYRAYLTNTISYLAKVDAHFKQQ